MKKMNLKKILCKYCSDECCTANPISQDAIEGCPILAEEVPAILAEITKGIDSFEFEGRCPKSMDNIKCSGLSCQECYILALKKHLGIDENPEAGK